MSDFITICAIDYGRTKLGLALAVNNIGYPFKTITNNLSCLSAIVHEYTIDLCVIGMPYTSLGFGHGCKHVLDFCQAVKKFVPVQTIDESYSSQESNNSNDHDAAYIILMRYLSNPALGCVIA